MALRSFPYPGSKAKFIDQILPLIPKHEYYFEPFGGSGAVLLNKPQVRVELFNDLNGAIICFFRVMSDPKRYPEFEQRILRLPGPDQKTFDWAVKTTEEMSADEMEIAVAWYYRITKAYALKDKKICSVRNPFNILPSLPSLHLRLRTVSFYQMDAMEFIKKFCYKRNKSEPDNNSFWYIDPPYPEEVVPEVKQLYLVQFTNENHRELLEFINSKIDEVKFLISGFHCPLYDEMLSFDKGWRLKEVKTPSRMSWLKNNGGQAKFNTECLWYNYPVEPNREEGMYGRCDCGGEWIMKMGEWVCSNCGAKQEEISYME